MLRPYRQGPAHLYILAVCISMLETQSLQKLKHIVVST